MAQYTIEYHAGIGSASDSSEVVATQENVIYGQTRPLSGNDVVDGEGQYAGSLIKDLRPGYTFMGWSRNFDSKDVQIDPNLQDSTVNIPDGDGKTIRLYAVWWPTEGASSFAVSRFFAKSSNVASYPWIESEWTKDESKSYLYRGTAGQTISFITPYERTDGSGQELLEYAYPGYWSDRNNYGFVADSSAIDWDQHTTRFVPYSVTPVTITGSPQVGIRLNYKPKTAKIYYHANGGRFATGPSTSVSTVEGERDYASLAQTDMELNLSRDGYAFAGWQYKSSESDDPILIEKDGDQMADTWTVPDNYPTWNDNTHKTEVHLTAVWRATTRDVIVKAAYEDELGQVHIDPSTEANYRIDANVSVGGNVGTYSKDQSGRINSSSGLIAQFINDRLPGVLSRQDGAYQYQQAVPVDVLWGSVAPDVASSITTNSSVIASLNDELEFSNVQYGLQTGANEVSADTNETDKTIVVVVLARQRVEVTFDARDDTGVPVGIAPASQNVRKGGKVVQPPTDEIPNFIINVWYRHPTDHSLAQVFNFSNDTVYDQLVLYPDLTGGQVVNVALTAMVERAVAGPSNSSNGPDYLAGLEGDYVPAAPNSTELRTPNYTPSDTIITTDTKAGAGLVAVAGSQNNYTLGGSASGHRLTAKDQLAGWNFVGFDFTDSAQGGYTPGVTPNSSRLALIPQSFRVRSDGSSHLYAYYKLARHNLVFDTGVGTWNTSGNNMAYYARNGRWVTITQEASVPTYATLVETRDPTCTFTDTNYAEHGLSFVGWYLKGNDEYTTAWDFANNQMPNEDLTLYAKWNATVRFEAGSGTSISSAALDQGNVEAEYGKRLPDLNIVVDNPENKNIYWEYKMYDRDGSIKQGSLFWRARLQSD